MTRAMAKRFEEDQRRNEEMRHVLDKPTKRHKIKFFEPKSRSTLELDEPQHAFFEFLESIEMKEGEPSSVNNK